MLVFVIPGTGAHVWDGIGVGVGDALGPLAAVGLPHAASAKARDTPAATKPNDFTGEWCGIHVWHETSGGEKTNVGAMPWPGTHVAVVN